jgi:hypothetical protein
LIKKFRCIEYTDDGCSVYECLWCKASWEARYFPMVYCGGCGIKFEGEIVKEQEPYDPAAYDRQDAINKAEKARRDNESRWVIEVRQLYDGEVDLRFGRGMEWVVAYDEDGGGGYLPRMSAKDVLAMLRRYQAMSRSHDETALFRRPDGAPAIRQEFRIRLTAERDLGKAHDVGYPQDIEYYERLIREEWAEADEEKGNGRTELA